MGWLRLIIVLVLSILAAAIALTAWRSIAAERSAMAEWQAWCVAVGGIPTEPRGMPPTCFAKEAIMERNRK